MTGPVVTRSVATDGAGRYRLDGLQPSTYTVRVTAPGFQALERRVNIADASPVVADLRLAVQSLQEDVVVRGEGGR